MAGLVDRIRGQQAMPGGLISNQLAHFTSSPLATPTLGAVTELSTGADVNRFFSVITMNKEAFGDTDGAATGSSLSLLRTVTITSSGIDETVPSLTTSVNV